MRWHTSSSSRRAGRVARARSRCASATGCRSSIFVKRCSRPSHREGQERTAMSRGFAVAANVKPEVIAAASREAEAAGYTSFWVNHPGPFDGLGALAVAAQQTRRMGLGIGVIPLHTRGPESIVPGVRTHALPLDRLLLGVGSPNPQSLSRVRDGVAALRAQLKTRI